MLYLHSFNRFILISLALLGLSVSSVNVAILNVDGVGNLLGASNVDVRGSLYNVEFLGGSCESIFGGCNEASDFLFTTSSDAVTASTALLAEVLTDIGLGNFDTNPLLTNDCFSSSSCFIFTPYAINSQSGTVQIAYAHNNIVETSDTTNTGGFSKSSTASNLNYAKWTQVSAVPVPAAIWLFGTGIIGLIGFSKRRKEA